MYVHGSISRDVKGSAPMSKGCKATVTVKDHEGFCVHGIVPCRQTTRRRQLSRYGQHGQDVNGGSVKYYCLKGGISLCWLSLLLSGCHTMDC